MTNESTNMTILKLLSSLTSEESITESDVIDAAAEASTHYAMYTAGNASKLISADTGLIISILLATAVQIVQETTTRTLGALDYENMTEEEIMDVVNDMHDHVCTATKLHVPEGETIHTVAAKYRKWLKEEQDVAKNSH